MKVLLFAWTVAMLALFTLIAAILMSYDQYLILMFVTIGFVWLLSAVHTEIDRRMNANRNQRR